MAKKNSKKVKSQETSSVESTPAKTVTKTKSTPVSTPSKNLKAKKQQVATKASAPQNENEPIEKLEAEQNSYIANSQATKAIDELRKYLERTQETKPSSSDKKDLFEDADEVEEDAEERANLYLKFEFKKYFSNRAVLKPVHIALTKPFLGRSNNWRTCLFIRDDLIKSEEDLEKIVAANIPTLKKILTLTQLKKIYKTYEKREELLEEYDSFVTDDAILSSLPNTLGKPFYHNTPKSPIAIRVTSTKARNELSLVTLGNQLKKVLDGTTFLPPVGVELSVRVGSLDQTFTTEELLSNIQDVAKHFSADLLVTVGLSTTELPILPLFYTKKLYSDEDVAENVTEEKVDVDADDAYTRALLELADEETVGDVLGKKFRESRKRRKLESGEAARA